MRISKLQSNGSIPPPFPRTSAARKPKYETPHAVSDCADYSHPEDVLFSVLSFTVRSKHYIEYKGELHNTV